MDNSKGCEWFFACAPLNQDLGPNDAKFEIFKPDINSLVRESIQNSMDAVDDDSVPVRMTFKIRGFQRDSFPSFFALKSHIDGCVDYWGKESLNVFNPIKQAISLSSGKERLYYIQVSDANTTGMDYERGNNKTKFHGFLHSTGASNKKKANSGGSFGIGKAAYFAMSPIRTIMVSTMTEDENRNVRYAFQGVSMLCTHTMPDGSLKTPTGFYSTNKEHPVTDIDEIPIQFQRQETGTDINIIGIQINSKDDKLRIYEEMKFAVMRNFWLAIYNKRLDVTIGDETLTSSNIVEYIDRYFPTIADNGRKGNINPRPYLDVVRKATPNNRQFILIEETLPNLGPVRLYIYRHPEGRGQIQFFRMPNMMVKRKKLPAANNFFAVFICDNEDGDKKLKKLETVAHDDWAAENWKPREADGRVSREAIAICNELETFIAESINNAFGINNQDTMEIAGLDRYLYIPTAAENDMLMSDSEALMSEPTGEFKDKGPSPTTTLNGEPKVGEIRVNDQPSTGKVFIGTITKAEFSDEGDLHSGSGRRRKSNPSPKPHVIPGETRQNKPSENGMVGLFAREIDVTYRGIAQKEKGVYYHYLIINSPEEIDNGRIVIETGREYGGSEPLNILESSEGTPRKNSLCELKLKQGTNKILIRFADNLSHTISLSAYEDKQ